MYGEHILPVVTVPEPKRVLIGVFDGGFTGIDTYAEQVAIAGAIAGIEVTLLASTPELAQELRARLGQFAIRVIDLGLTPLTPHQKLLIRLCPALGLMRLRRGLAQTFDRLQERYPVAHLNHPGLATAIRPFVDRVCVAAWFYPHDLIGRIRETWHHTGGRGTRSVFLTVKSVSHYMSDARGYAESDCVTAPTELLAHQLLARNIAAVVCPPPTEAIENVQVHSDAGTEIRLLICAGDLSHPRKNVAAALRAVRLLPDTGQRIVVELIGRHGSALQHDIQALPPHIIVRFDGPLASNEVKVRMRASSALLLPSLFEEWGYVAVESMMCGTPVVTFPVYPFGEMIAPGFGARACENSDEAFADAISRLLAEGRPPDLPIAAAERFGSLAIGRRLSSIWFGIPG